MIKTKLIYEGCYAQGYNCYDCKYRTKCASYTDDCVPSSRSIVYPAIYRHFKHELELNKYFYATIGISYPKQLEEIQQDSTKIQMIIEHSETNQQQIIYNIDGKWYHSKEWCKDKLVMYKSLYDNHITWVISINNFKSEVNHEKYPNIKQKFKFYLMRWGEE